MVLRYVDQSPDFIRNLLQRRRDWGKKLSSTVTYKQPGSWFSRSLEITAEDEECVLAMQDFLLATKADYRKVISGDWIYFYSNDPSFIDNIQNLPFLQRQNTMQRSRVELRGTPGTVRLQKTGYQFRSYFKGYLKLTDQQKQALKRYLVQHPDMRMSPAVKEWTESARELYIGDYYFIDHNDMGIITMLSLMVPGIIRRTKPIEITK